jgi:ribonuclease HI
MRYAVRLHFPVSNNMAEYEALLCGLRIAIETGIKCLNVRGDSQLVIDQVMKRGWAQALWEYGTTRRHHACCCVPCGLPSNAPSSQRTEND